MDEETVIRLRRVVLRLAKQLHAASADEGLNPTMLSRVVGKLDSYGLIRRLRDPDDFRAARVEATPEGEQTYQRIAAQRAAIISECVVGLPPDREAALIAALPALENLAEDLRTTVRRNRVQPAADRRTYHG